MAVISKILTSTLVAGTTYVSFTDSDIPNSLIRVFADDPDLMYQTVSLTGNTLTLTYDAQTSNKSIALDIVKQGLEVIDALDSTDASKALSANQGRILKTYIDNLPTPVFDLSDLDDVEITEISDGQVLAWDDDLQKFVNVDQSGGTSSCDYSTTEQTVGKWIDNSTIYKKTVFIENLPNGGNVWTNYEHGISNLNKVIDISGIVWFSDGSTFGIVPYVLSNNIASQIAISVNTTYIRIMVGSNRSSDSAYVTLMYTKSS